MNAESANKNRFEPYLLIGLALALFCIPAFFILPAGDDWATSQPIQNFSLEALLPRTFWRPFEGVFRYLVGIHEGLHPALLHLVTVSGHIGSTFLLYGLAHRISQNETMSIAVAVLFAVFPANAAAVWSVDSAIQTWSTFFGLLSLLILTEYRTYSAFFAAGLSCLIAALWKESGIAWLVAAPVFSAAIKSLNPINTLSLIKRDLLVQLVIAIILLIFYFLFRWVLSEGALVEVNSGRYSVNLNPLLWVKNALMLLGVSITATDTIALFKDKNLIIASISFFITIPLVVWVLIASWGALRIAVVALMAVGLLALMSPHLVLGQVSEMYAHPIVAGVIISAVIATRHSRTMGRSVAVIFGLTLMATALVSGHKWINMYESGVRASKVAASIEKHYHDSGFPSSVCTIKNEKDNSRTYSVFYMDAPYASLYGRSIFAKTNWLSPKEIINVSDVSDCPGYVKHIWHVALDGQVFFTER